MEQVNDPVFAGKIIGDGVAVVPSEGVLHAPADGIVCMVADTGHAVGMKLANGAEILMHVGLDTVKLNGKYYSVKVKAGDRVNAGQVLLTFEMDKMKAEGFDLTTPVILSSGDRFEMCACAAGAVSQGDALYQIVMK